MNSIAGKTTRYELNFKDQKLNSAAGKITSCKLNLTKTIGQLCT